jgi:hypothetical protein
MFTKGTAIMQFLTYGGTVKEDEPLNVSYISSSSLFFFFCFFCFFVFGFGFWIFFAIWYLVFLFALCFFLFCFCFVCFSFFFLVCVLIFSPSVSHILYPHLHMLIKVTSQQIQICFRDKRVFWMNINLFASIISLYVILF